MHGYHHDGRRDRAGGGRGSAADFLDRRAKDDCLSGGCGFAGKDLVGEALAQGHRTDFAD
jgi:hypothetical protein